MAFKVGEKAWGILEGSRLEIGWHKVKSDVHKHCSSSVAFFSQLFSSTVINFVTGDLINKFFIVADKVCVT